LQQQNNRNGIILFGAIALLVLATCLVAYIMTGNQGIEERFANAVGLTGEPEEEEGGGVLGFALEGNHLSYLIILVILILGTALLYIKYKI